jgi:hypothetical protein
MPHHQRPASTLVLVPSVSGFGSIAHLSKNLDDIASRDRRSANIIHHFE